MKRWISGGLVAGYLSIILLVACAPKAAPVAPAPPAVASPASVPTPIAPAVSPEDAAWAEVVKAAQKEGVVNMYSFALGGPVGQAVAEASGTGMVSGWSSLPSPAGPALRG